MIWFKYFELECLPVGDTALNPSEVHADVYRQALVAFATSLMEKCPRLERAALSECKDLADGGEVEVSFQ